MGIVKFQVEGFECERCGHKWVPRDIKKPAVNCPHCKSPYWDKPIEFESISKASKKRMEIKHEGKKRNKK